MSKVLLSIILSLILVSPANAITLKEFNEELSKGNKLMLDEMNRLGKLINTVDKEDLKQLNTFIGDEGMTEAEVLNMGVEFTYSGLSSFQFYLDHLNKPTKTDAVGNQFKQ